MVDREFDATAYHQGLEEGRRESSARIKLLEDRLRVHAGWCSMCNGGGSYLQEDAATKSFHPVRCLKCIEDRKALGLGERIGHVDLLCDG